MLLPARGFKNIYDSQIKKNVLNIFLHFWPLYSQKSKLSKWPPFLHLLSTFHNFFQNLEITTTAEMATKNVCVHLTFTILSLLSMSFLISLQSKFGNFETSYSVTFCLKISELFSKPKNSNYSQYGGSKRICNKTEIYFQFPQKGPMRS